MDKTTKEDVNEETQSEDINSYTCINADNGPPTNKRTKLSGGCTQELNLSLNSKYTTESFVNMLKAQWNAPTHTTDFKDNATGTEIYHDPYQICLLPQLLHYKDSCKQLVNEMIEGVYWSRKQMDLYEFYQSADLSSMSHCRLLSNFLKMLRRTVRPWLEKVTNLKLDYVSASCSMYTCGDYLLVHDDLLKDRQVAFIYYLSPWEGIEQWSTSQGGCLEIFGSDENCFPQFPVKRKISPKNNQLVFFKVGSRSFHQVGEVTNFDYPRLTINGWFHGASNEDTTDAMRPFAKLNFQQPQLIPIDLKSLLNEVYLRPSTKKNIQKRIEDNSEICLYDFFKHEIFMDALSELRNDDKLKWRRQGPANAQNYEVLEVDSTSQTITQMLTLFSSTEMFKLLQDYTDLDLAGADSASASYCLELQRWSHGNYTVLGDGDVCEENTLDLIYYLNAAEGAGIITYLSPEDEHMQPTEPSYSDDDDDDSVLLTITPVDNALNIVYRCENTTKFTKYVSRNTPLENGPVFVISCSYKE